MTTMSREAPERQDIEALLPWHAAGTLSRRDAERVERALVDDRELARRYDLVREELNETIHLNESLGAPSARAMDKLFAAIDAETPVAKKASFDVIGRVVEFLSGFSTRKLAWSATAAAVALLLQAAVLTTFVVKDMSVPGPELASHGNGTQLLVIRFSPKASVDDVTRFLNIHKAVVVNGPRKGNFYDVRLAGQPKSSEELAKTIREMKAKSGIIELVATKD